MTSSTLASELSVSDDRNSVWELWAAFNLVCKQATHVQERTAGDSAQIPIIDQRRSYRLLVLLMLVTSPTRQLTKESCRQALALRDGSVDVELFESIWADTCELVELLGLPDNSSKFSSLLSQWAGQ